MRQELPVIIFPYGIEHLRIKKMKFKLITFSTSKGTTGKLYLLKSGEHQEICYTIERPWLQNKVNVSCIPAGTYTIKPVKSPKFGNTYQVADVIGRTHILIHKANKPSELHGCIAPVSEFGVMGNEWAGFGSSDAYYPLMKLFAGEEHTLEIKRY